MLVECEILLTTAMLVRRSRINEEAILPCIFSRLHVVTGVLLIVPGTLCKEANSNLCYKHHTATGTHVPSYSVICHPAEVTFPPLPQPIKAGTRFSDPRGMQGLI